MPFTRLITRHKAIVCSVGVTPDGTRVLSSLLDGTLCVSNFETGKLVCKIHGLGVVYNIRFTSDNKHIVCVAENRVHLITLDAGKVVRSFNINSKIIDITLTPDNQYVISCAHKNNTCCVTALQTGNLVNTIWPGQPQARLPKTG